MLLKSASNSEPIRLNRKKTARGGGTVRDARSADLSRYYDIMHLWTRFSRGFRTFSGREANSIHRWLIDADTGKFSPSTIHKIMLSTGIGADGPLEALDAGCGYGGTIFALHAALGGRWHGVTISARQFSAGRRLARERNLGAAVTFSLGSYDEPQAGSYNLIYGIESLAHSVDPARTVGNLVRALRPGGAFMIVDDMPVDAVPARWSLDLARLKQHWRFPVMPSARQWSMHLEAAGCELVETRDLSALMRPRSAAEIAMAIGEVNGRRRWRDRLGLRSIGEAEIGGLILENLGRERVVRYTLIHARKRR
jgi:SAM-dependent methyltransferase